MTTEQLIPYREELSAVPKFQWIKTDKAGHVTYFKDVSYHNNMVLVEFTDGTRVNYDMLGDAVLRIEDDSMLLNLGLDMEFMGQPQSIQSPLPVVNIGKAAVGASPIHALLEKQKHNPVPVEIAIELNLPSVSLYNVLSQSFDNADEEIVDFIVAELDVPLIRAAVRDAITNFYMQHSNEQESTL